MQKYPNKKNDSSNGYAEHSSCKKSPKKMTSIKKAINQNPSKRKAENNHSPPLSKSNGRNFQSFYPTSHSDPLSHAYVAMSESKTGPWCYSERGGSPGLKFPSPPSRSVRTRRHHTRTQKQGISFVMVAMVIRQHRCKSLSSPILSYSYIADAQWESQHFKKKYNQTLFFFLLSFSFFFGCNITCTCIFLFPSFSQCKLAPFRPGIQIMEAMPIKHSEV